MNWLWRIELFGGLQAQRGETTIDRFRTQKTGAVLTYLALFPRRHGREHLIETLWPEVESQSGRNNLSLALSSLRRQLEWAEDAPGSLIVADRNSVALDQTRFSSDVAEFEAAFRAGQMQKVVALYRGPLLSGFYEDWIALEEQRLEELFIAALRAEIERREKIGDWHGALETAYQGARAAPLRDEPRELIQRLRRSPASQVLEIETPAAPRDNLPPVATRFFGRKNELDELTRLFAQKSRLVTLCGPGGSGKTRLALEWARNFAKIEKSAIFFVPLAEVRSENRFWDALLDAVAPTRAGVIDVPAAVFAALKGQDQPLLMLDNCEQFLPEMAPLVARLREKVENLGCLATSRRRLEVAGEHELILGPLATPPQKAAPAELLNWPSVRLFCDRAQLSRPDFAVTPKNAGEVAALCARLEGLPLALELAAARANVFSPGQMLQRFDGRLDLGQKPARSRDFAPRQASLRATLDWSFALLAPATQEFFAALAMFAGGWSEDAANAIWPAEAVAPYLDELVAASLIRREANGRFFQLETIREFGGEQLSEEQRAIFGERHARFFLDFATRLQPENGENWLVLARGEADNFRAALAFWLENDGAMALRLATLLAPFWDSDGRFFEGHDWLQKALNFSSEAPPELRAEALWRLAHLELESGDFAAVREHGAACAQIHRERGETAELARILGLLGMAAMNQSDPDAPAILEEALHLARPGQDAALVCELTFQLTSVHLGSGAFARGLELAEETLILAEKLGDARRLTHSQMIVGHARWLNGDLDGVRQALEASRATMMGHGNPVDQLRVLWGLGHVALEQGRLEEARGWMDGFLKIVREIDFDYGRLYALESFAPWVLALEKAELSARLLGAADALHDKTGIPLLPISRHYVEPAEQRAREILGEKEFALARGAGRLLDAETLFREVEKIKI